MLAEPTGIVWLVLAAMGVPGIGLLLFARFGFAARSMQRADGLRRALRRTGLAVVILTGFLILYLLPRLIDGPRSGGLGSVGDPLGAFLMLGYLFVPASLTFAVAEATAACSCARRSIR